jgi:acetyltransferase-like isoleucine patch superfamily enzyme
MAKWGLRRKSLMALLLACLVALAPAALIGWQVLDGVREHFGRAFSDNFTQLNRQRVLAPVSRELALSQRLADSEVTRRWLRNENDPAARELFFREADGYRRDLLGGAYFIASAASGNYYFNDDKPLSEAPRYTLSPSAADDGWFYATVKSPARYNINVNPDLKLKTTKVWINVQIREDVVIGAGCILSKDVYVDHAVKIGDRCKIQNSVSVYNGVEIGDDVFVGPNACFTNDKVPRAFNADWSITPTFVHNGASIGANATIVCGITIGEYAMVAAGSVVTKDVAPYTLVMGNPARAVAKIDREGNRVSGDV